MSNYFDKNGNYINSENLSLAEIYARGIEAGRQQQAEDVRKLMEEDRLLDDRDGTIAGRAHE